MSDLDLQAIRERAAQVVELLSGPVPPSGYYHLTEDEVQALLADRADREQLFSEAVKQSVLNLGAMSRWRARAEAAEADREALRLALDCIVANAESWHGPVSEDNHHHAKALAVIARWARDPATIPESVRLARLSSANHASGQ